MAAAQQIATAKKLVAMLHRAEVASDAALGLENLLYRGAEPVKHAILTAVTAPGALPAGAPFPNLANLLKRLEPVVWMRIQTAEANGYPPSLEEAIQQATVLQLPQEELSRARENLAILQEEERVSHRERIAALGPDALKTPDEYLCPIMRTLMEDPVIATDGHCYDRSAIAILLELPEEHRVSPMTQTPLGPSLVPNIALAQRITAHKEDLRLAAEVSAERAQTGSGPPPLPPAGPPPGTKRSAEEAGAAGDDGSSKQPRGPPPPPPPLPGGGVYGGVDPRAFGDPAVLLAQF